MKGTLTFPNRRAAHAVANGLLARVSRRDGVAILAHNHRWFVIASYGRSEARIIYSTASSPARPDQVSVIEA